jgi:hypothetical protein
MKVHVLLGALAALAVAASGSAALAGETTQQVQEATDQAVQVEKGERLFSGTGNLLGSVYRVTAEGDAQVIVNSRLMTVPASTLSRVEGKLRTSLTKRELASKR